MKQSCTKGSKSIEKLIQEEAFNILGKKSEMIIARENGIGEREEGRLIDR